MEVSQTEPGALLESQIEEVLEFATRKQIFNLVGSFLGFIRKSAENIAQGRYRALVSDENPPKDVAILDALELLMGEIDWEEQFKGWDELASVDDRLWYFSLITFSIHTYLDMYTKGIIELISKHPELTKELEKHLTSIARKSKNKTGPKILKVSQMSQMGVPTRLKNIEVGLGIDSILVKIIGENEFTKYQDAFTKFKDIRHKIAHRNPRLEIDEYSFEELEKDLESTELDFEELTQSWEKIEFIHDTILELKESMNEMSHIIKKLTLVIGMATIYPTLLDAVLDVMLSES